jgi:hypothetical protein
MVYKKRHSTTLEKAEERLHGLQCVNPLMNLGVGFSLQEYAALVETAKAQLQRYHIAQAITDFSSP